MGERAPGSLGVEIGLTPSVDRTTSKIYMVNVLTIDNSRYMTSKGIKIGDTAQKVEDTYGKPVSHYFSPGYLPGGYLVEFPGLLYKNMLFVIDTSNYKVIGFMIGDFSHSW